MAREALPIGSWGRLTSTRTESGPWTSTARYRDVDGLTRQVRKHGTTRTKAENSLLAALKARGGITGGEIGSHTKFAVLVDFWAEEIEGTDILPQTRAEYLRLAGTSLIPELGELQLRELTVGLVDGFIKKQRKSTPSMARNLRSLLTSILAIAVRHGAMDSNPVLSTARVPRPAREVKALDIQDALRLRAYARAFRTGTGMSGPPPTRDLPDVIDFMLGTGARIGEALAVRWRDLDLDSSPATATFSGTIVYVKGAGYSRQPFTKSSAGMRTVTLPPFLVTVLKERQAVATSKIVFPARHGGIRQTQNLHRAWRAMRAGTEWEWVTPHIFRKTVATLLGADTGSKQLGHSSPEVTRRHYIKPSHIAPDTTLILEQLGTVIHLEGAPHPGIDDTEAS